MPLRADEGDVARGGVSGGHVSDGGDIPEADRKVFERDAKIGLLGTVDSDGRPHLTLITSLQARGPRELMFGQFTEGRSKTHTRENPRAAFLVMSPGRDIWRGRARWTHETKTGEDNELYNRKPMFRYNAYFGIHTVHYLDVVGLAGKEKLSAARLVAATLATTLLGRFLATGRRERVLTPWAERHLAKLSTLKFACHVDDDGYPVITPPVACRSVDGRRLVLASACRRDHLGELGEGRCVAVFAINPAAESVLVRGRFSGYRRSGGLAVGSVDVDWVYNSMPPKHGQIYPLEPLAPVRAF